MKILLSWLLDYIDRSMINIDVEQMVHLFNIRTAEIESFEKIEIPYSSMFVVQVTALADQVTVFCPELNRSMTLPKRSDCVVGKWYLVFNDQSATSWVVLSDFSADKDGIMPAVHVTKDSQKGDWRLKLSKQDWILDVDNKSINHRPDLWGHYGIAREIAAFLGCSLKSIEPFLSSNVVQQHVDVTPANTHITIKDMAKCSRFAAIGFDQVAYQDSDIYIAIRLALLGIKPINAVVDVTNYVMLDIGHPMHVFNASTFQDKSIVVRLARSGEVLQLLDGQEITLTEQDLVVANSKEAISLAGIMGGKASGYFPETQSIILEAAGFDAATIRTTAQRFKLRSEASMRFEKELDPMQNIIALKRYVALAEALGLLPKNNKNAIICAGSVVEPKTIAIRHDFIESRLGMSIESEFIKNALTRLGFGLLEKDFEYIVTVPTYRSTKDISITEDILEEVIRSFGFENIIPQLPYRQTVPFSLRSVHNVNMMKRQLAYGLNMHELRDYMMYDNAWVSQFNRNLDAAVTVKSPLSENWTTLVTSLIPHLLKAVAHNAVAHDTARFFEYNRTWSKAGSDYSEIKVLAGIIFDKKDLNFYDCKIQLQSLWDIFGVTVEYQKPTQAVPAWYDQYQTAELVVDGQVIGRAGMGSKTCLHGIIEGNTFIFEVDGLWIENQKIEQKRFKQWSKYQDVTYDISLFVPLHVSIDQICSTIKQAHKNIEQVSVVDFFEKPEWKQHRAVTIRYSMSNYDKTMTKQEIELIVQAVYDALKVYDVQIR